MPARAASARKLARVITLTVDVVLFTPQAGELGVLVMSSEARRARSRDRWTLPSSTLGSNETLDDAAMRVAREALGATPASLEQAVASGGRNDVTITYFGLVPSAAVSSTTRGSWISTSEFAIVGARQSEEIEVALSTLRARIDQQPIAFSLLATTFTLSELQSVYELLLGRRLHKASFRRSLRASSLVEATDEWRSEGRGRPAQLFRYAPPRRRRMRRGIRFDLLG